MTNAATKISRRRIRFYFTNSCRLVTLYYSKLALTSDYLLLVRLLITQWYLVRVSWSMVYIVLVKRGYFWCIMDALRNSSAPTTRYNINMLMPILFKHVNCPINVISAFDKPCILKRVGKVGLCHGTVMTKKVWEWSHFLGVGMVSII